MGSARYVGRVGALAAALGIGSVRRHTTRMTVSLSAAALVLAPAMQTSSEDVRLSADATALIMCGTTCPTPDDYWVESVMNQFIEPTHPNQTVTPVAVTTPEEYWPIGGLFRIIGSAVGDPNVWGPGGPGWPDQPWWKLSGLFDLTINQSIQAGVTDLEAAMAEYGGDPLIIFGDSQSAAIAVEVKRRLAQQYPVGTEAPDISFVLGGDTNLPNGGLNARFPGLYIPILDLLFNGPEPTDTQFHTDVITRQYDGAADFPLYPLNVIADLNAVMGFLFLHSRPFDVALPPDPTTSSAYQGTYGDSSYYFFETQDLPLFAPLRMLGVPEHLIDVFEPIFRVIVELGYDRTIPPWVPTPARLIPSYDPAEVMSNLAAAIGEGVENALAVVGLPPVIDAPQSVAPTPTTLDEATAADTGEATPPAAPAPDARQYSKDKTVFTVSDDVMSSEESDEAAIDAVTSDAAPKDFRDDLPTSTPRSLVRESLGADQQVPDRFDRDEDDQRPGTTDSGGEAEDSDESSSTATSPAASSSSDNTSDDASGDDDGAHS